MAADDILAILDVAQSFQGKSANRYTALQGKTVINLFQEPSTRTRTSFEIAGKRLAGDVVNIEANLSSIVKGESIVDTTRTLNAMHPDVIIVRHGSSGAPHVVARHTSASVVNAGDGAHEHPTQALLDALTILDHKNHIAGLTVVIVGDILHSRVARSNVHLLTKLGAHVRLAAPKTLMPDAITTIVEEGVEGSVQRAPSLDAALDGADVVMALRVQFERQQEAFFPSVGEFHSRFGLTAARLNLAHPEAIVMHPGPFNRGIEIAPEVADGPRSVILDQVENGVAVRMAVLSILTSNRQ